MDQVPTQSQTTDNAVPTSVPDDLWRKRNVHYYRELERIFARHIPPGSTVLEIECGTGELLASLRPSVGVGLDLDRANIAAAQQRHPHPQLQFHVGGLEQIPPGQNFDFIIICNAVGLMRDVQAIFTAISPFCRPDTRVLVSYHNALWQPVLTFGSAVGLRRPVEGQNWLSRDDLRNLFELSGYQVIREFSEVLLPYRIPLLHTLCNRLLVKFSPFRHLGLEILMIARPVMPAFPPNQATVSVIIPTRNERGNVQAAIERTPDMGTHTELIFVDGWSSDGTPEEIQRCIRENPHRDIRFIPQEGQKGKGQAVRQGFAAAKGDILMILDADLTVAPEELPKFVDAIVRGTGEFINGTRLVYPMHEQAMRFLNKCGNRFFSILFTWLVGQRFRDTLCGTKVLTRRNYARIAAGRSYFGEFDPFGDFDLIFGAAKNDLKITEIPVRYGARSYGETNISRFRDGFLLLKMSWVAFWKLKLR